MDRLYITYKDYENGPAEWAGMSWRSGRCKITYPATNAGKRSARAKVRTIEAAGRKWGRIAIINREEQS